MNIFSQKLLTIYFVVLSIYTIFWFVIIILRRRAIDKKIEALNNLPDNKKEGIVRLYKRIISTQRIFLWILPFGFLLMIAVFILLFAFPEMVLGFPEIDIRQFLLFMGIIFVLVFIRFIEDSDYKTKILRAIDK